VRVIKDSFYTLLCADFQNTPTHDLMDTIRANRSRLLPPIKREVIEAYKKDF
jgi:hypothetical protein